MPLGMKVGLCPGHIVLRGDPTPPPKGAQSPIFGPCVLWPKQSPISATAEHLCYIAEVLGNAVKGSEAVSILE